jgi:hypothetical protein
MRAYAKHIIMLMVAAMVAVGAFGQVRQSEQAVHPDQLSPTRLADILGDTIPEEKEDSVVVIKQNNSVKSPIPYSSNDSMVVHKDGRAFLFGKGNIKFEGMELESEYIRMNMDSSTIYATGRYDSVNDEWIGRPVYKDQQDSYSANEMIYNLETQKGFIKNVVTQQGEGYIIAEKAKKVGEDVLMMAGGKYTTCDQHEHPHFYLLMTKAKVKPGDYVATGPAYMVVGEVPLPLAIPFGFFPFTNKYSSGLIMPNFGDDGTRGLYLSGLGYYFAINDYVDLEVKGDIYSKGTWAVYANSRYTKRYWFNGNVSIAYRTDVTGERDMPDYEKRTNFSVKWTHSQDPKANPYCNFSASVNFSTSGYNRSNINSYYNTALYSENEKSSSINYTQRFPNSPWNISLTMNVNQRTKDSTISLTLPQLTVNMSKIYPFKRKKPVGKEKWYEKIGFSYTGEGRISVSSIKEDKILHSDFLRDWQTGMRHSIPSISATFALFKYLNITPSISLTDRMYFQRVDCTFDEQQQALTRDTTRGFYNVFNFDVGLSMSTKLYGFFTPSKKVFPNSKVEKFRHVITPSLSFSYHPDFGKAGWGYYGSYEEPIYSGVDSVTGRKIQKIDDQGNPVYEHRVYDRFPGAIYGNAPNGAAASLHFSIDNNLEMKIVNRKDTTGKEPFKVVSLIDQFSISGGYNFIADSMNWERFNILLRFKTPWLKALPSISLRTTLDPYMYQLDSYGRPVRTNKQYWKNGRFPHWSGTGFQFSYTFNNDTFKKWFGKKDGKKHEEHEEEQDEPFSVTEDGMGVNGKVHDHDHNKETEAAEVDDGYVKTKINWSLSFNYSVNYGAGSEFDYEKMYYKMVWTHYLSLSGNISLGDGWKVSASTTFDFKNKRFNTATFNVSRDLHCWNMSASFVPFGPNKSYTFHIGVNASMLADLKYDKTSYNSTNKRVDWW